MGHLRLANAMTELGLIGGQALRCFGLWPLWTVPDGCGEVLCQTNLNALGELEMCYDVYISRQSPFFSVTQSYSSQNSGRCTPALRSKRNSVFQNSTFKR